MIHLVCAGANDRRNILGNGRQVARALRELPGVTIRSSRLYRTPAWPPGIGTDFVNAAVLIDSPMGPAALLRDLHRIEARHGRIRRVRWGARTLDLDLIASGALVRPDPQVQGRWRELSPEDQRTAVPDRLILPHPRIQDRAFALLPLSDIVPNWRHPLTGRRIADMAAALSASARLQIRAIGPLDGVVNRKRRA